MSKLWLIAERQFKKEVLKRGFLIVLLSLPLFLAFTIGMGVLTTRLRRESTTLGYVDQAAVLVQIPPAPKDGEVKLVSFQTPAAARAALEAGQINAYYVLPGDYPRTRQVELIYFQPPASAATSYFHHVVRQNLLAGQAPEVVERALSGPEVTVRATQANREFALSGPTLSAFLPVLAAVLFSFLILTVSGTLMQAVVEEKQNRTIEVVITSVAPGTMLAGKISGILGMALALLLAWVVFFLAAAWLGGSVLEIGWLQDIQPNWRDLGMLTLVALPVSLCIAAFMTMLGATIVEEQEAQQVGPLMFLILLLPLYLIIPIAQNPNSALAIGASMFPLTAVPTLAMRSVFAEISAGQFLVAALIALASGLGLVWLAGRAFRVSMLRYGQRLSLSQLFGRARG